MERAKLLQKTTVFSALSEKECQMLAPVFKSRRLANEEVLFRQGAPGDALAVVVEGRLVVEVEGGEGVARTVISRCRKADVVGEMSCLDPAPRSATVRATAESEVLLMTRSMLDSLKCNAPALFSQVVLAIGRQMAKQLDEANALIAELLKVKRAPTGPRQPSLKAMEEARLSGRPVEGEVVLRPQGVLKRFDQRQRERLASVMVARQFQAGEVICLEGEVAQGAYIVAAGKVDVLSNVAATTYRLATVEEGALLGQRALLREGKRSATLRAAASGATLLGLSRTRFNELLAAQSPLAIEFQEMVTVAGIRQLRQATELTAYLGAREQKRVLPRSQGQSAAPVQPSPVQKAVQQSPVRKRLQKMVTEETLDESEDVEALAAAYLETALQDWDVTPSELKNIRVVRGAGEMSAAEKKMREKFNK